MRKNKSDIIVLAAILQADLLKIDREFMTSPEFKSDMYGFDLKAMKKVETFLLKEASYFSFDV